MIRFVSVLAIVVIACGHPGPVLGDDMPSDLVEVVNATLDAVEDEAPALTECLDGLVIRHTWDLDDRASYDPDTSTILLRVPSTASRFEFSLAHEIAHHLEFTCPAQMEIRARFLEAQGRDAGTYWFDGDPWEDIPSEQFATAFAEVVTGGTDTMRHVPVTESSRTLIDTWAKGELDDRS